MSENINVYTSPTFNLIKNKPSFFGGVSSLLDFEGMNDKYNSSSTEMEADSRALSSDWRAVGEDIRKTINIYNSNEQKKQKKEISCGSIA